MNQLVIVRPNMSMPVQTKHVSYSRLNIIVIPDKTCQLF